MGVVLANATPVESLAIVANTIGNQYERLEGANCKAPQCHKGHGRALAVKRLALPRLFSVCPCLSPRQVGKV